MPLSKVHAVFVALVLALALVASTARAAEPEHVRVVMPDLDNLQYLAFWVAKGAGHFRDEGLELDLSAPTAPPATLQLVHEKTADVFVLPPPLYIQLMAEKFPIVLVANLLQNDPIDVVVRRSVFEARKLDSHAPLAERLAGLHGLRVGVAPGPPPRLRALFAAAGMNADDEIEIVTIRGPNQNEAFAKNEVDVLYCHTPYLETALVDQDAVMLVNQSAGEVAKLSARQIHAVVVTQQIARARPALAFALARAVLRATALVHTNRAAAVDAVLRALPHLDRKKVETLVAIYEPAVPATPRVSVEGIDPQVVLYPAGRSAPDLRGIDLHDYVAPAFVERAIADAAEAARPWWRRRLGWLIAAALAIVIAALAVASRRASRRT